MTRRSGSAASVLHLYLWSRSNGHRLHCRPIALVCHCAFSLILLARVGLWLTVALDGLYAVSYCQF